MSTQKTIENEQSNLLQRRLDTKTSVMQIYLTFYVHVEGDLKWTEQLNSTSVTYEDECDANATYELCPRRRGLKVNGTI